MISEQINTPNTNKHMVQYGVWSDCCNNCDFCLRLNRKTTSNKKKIELIQRIRENIRYVDWKNKFSYGISLLGGELFYIKDKAVQTEFLLLIDDIIEYVLKPNTDICKFSTVTNGLYDPEFLYKVVDKIVDAVGINRVDINFSYDIKYRYKTEKLRQKAINNINNFHKRYNYGVGVQMILTQYVIDQWKQGLFDVNTFMSETFPDCILSFLYPHPINSGKQLDDFQFNRNDFFKFLTYLKQTNYNVYLNFIYSTKNSGTFKYTGFRDKRTSSSNKQIPILSDGKEEIMSCGHSVLYRCYADSDRCLMCDLELLDQDL